MTAEETIELLKEELEYEKSHPFERLRAMGFVVNESEIQESDRLRTERNDLREALVEACAIADRWVGCDGPHAEGSDYKMDQARIKALFKVGARE